LLKSILAGAAVALVATAATAAEDWVTVVRTIEVKAPAAKVWGLVGGYCDFGKVRNVPCVYTKGAGGLGTIRKLNGVTEEVKVGEGQYSYGYFQTVGARTQARYHGNVSVTPSADNKTSKIAYTLIYDQAGFASDAERASQKAAMETSFQEAIETMKKMAEGAK
jgi:opacity protein-like surface antigen